MHSQRARCSSPAGGCACQLLDVGLGSNAERQGALRAAARAEEQRAKLVFFAPELAICGIDPEAAGRLDEPTLRAAFRERSRLLHPDLNPTSDGVDPADFEGGVVPSIQELNRAYEQLKMMLD